MNLKYLILDFDGVFTDGGFYYSKEGKQLKKFGPDDSDALNFIRKFLKVSIITADENGFDISNKRINDIGLELNLVKTQRLDWINKKYNITQVIYVADSFTDYHIFKEVAYSICFNNSDEELKKIADFVTQKDSGKRGLAQAIDHILNKFFNNSIYNYTK